LFVAVGKPGLNNMMASHTVNRKVFVIKTFNGSDASCVLLCVDDIDKSFVLNSSKKEELCVIKVRRDVNVMLLFARNVSLLEEIQFREVQVKYANFSTTVGGLNRHCKENTSC
jgi:hypothetical protein